jgi:hypothetical protein
MSTKMHNFRIPKDQWWDFAAACRSFYMENYPMLNVLNEIVARQGASAYRKISDIVDIMTRGDTGYTVDLQLFDEGDTWGDTYLIRPLEQGWFFSNNCDDFAAGFNLTQVNYDNRSDVPPEDEKNEAVAKWVDKQIDDKQYFIYNILHRDDFMTIAIDALIKGTKASVE